MATTEQGPLTVNDLLNKLKLIPGEWKIQITATSVGDFYVYNLEIIDECTVELIMQSIPTS